MMGGGGGDMMLEWPRCPSTPGACHYRPALDPCHCFLLGGSGMRGMVYTSDVFFVVCVGSHNVGFRLDGGWTAVMRPILHSDFVRLLHFRSAHKGHRLSSVCLCTRLGVFHADCKGLSANFEMSCV